MIPPTYPGTVWDGSSKNPFRVHEGCIQPPDTNDWAQAVAEIQGIETDLIAKRVRYVTVRINGDPIRIMVQNDRVVYCINGSPPGILTLPDCLSCIGDDFLIINAYSGMAVTVASRDPTHTPIFGSPSGLTLTNQWTCVSLRSIGTGWVVVAQRGT